MIVEFQERIRLRMRGGGSFDEVEEEIIERSGLDERPEGGAVALRLVVRAHPRAACRGRSPGVPPEAGR